MNEQPLDLRASISALRRRRLAIAIVGLVGLSLGLLNMAAHRSTPSAVTLVLLPTQPGAAGGTTVDAQSQAVVAGSTPLQTAATQSLSPPVDANQVRVTVVPDSTSVLRIRAQAPKSQQAVALADGVANNYIAFVKSNRIMTGVPLIIQKAAVTPSSSAVSRAVKNGGIGLAAGLLLAAIVVLMRAKRDHRLRRRDQIARAIGVPVLATIESGSYKSAAQWCRLLEHFDPSASTAWNLRKVLRHMIPGDLDNDLTICVAAFAQDTAALATGPQLALAAAAFGLPSDLEAGDQEVFAPLRAARATLHNPGHVGRIVEFGPRDIDPWKQVWDTPERRVANGAQLEVSVVALERSRPELLPLTGRLILAVSSGFPVTDDLAGVALAATEVNLKIDGIVLVNPEPGDSTVGMIADRDDELSSAGYRERQLDLQQSNAATPIGRAG
jgi:hypothetical protein